MGAGDDELVELLSAVSEARAAKAEAKQRAHLAYCAAVAAVVEYEARARTGPAVPPPDEDSEAGNRLPHAERGAQARAARHLKMSRANVGALLRDLAAANPESGGDDACPLTAAR